MIIQNLYGLRYLNITYLKKTRNQQLLCGNYCISLLLMWINTHLKYLQFLCKGLKGHGSVKMDFACFL